MGVGLGGFDRTAGQGCNLGCRRYRQCGQRRRTRALRVGAGWIQVCVMMCRAVMGVVLMLPPGALRIRVT
jgi:hypothetical protein